MRPIHRMYGELAEDLVTITLVLGIIARATRFREQIDQKKLKLLLVIDANKNQLRDILPYDILKKNTIATISLAELFPKLNYSSITQIITTELDRLSSI